MVVLIMVISNMVEMVCYAIFFTVIFLHDNTLAKAVLKPGEIKQRNQVNAFTMFGQMVTWLLEVSYVLMLLYFAVFSASNTRRELPALLKLAEFTVIPIVQILTSAPLRKFIFKSRL